MNCSTKFCRNPRGKRATICHKCRSRRFRERHPISALYANAKAHAKARGIGFLLTRDEFADFCERTNYHLTKGRTSEAMSIDRIRGNEPYQAGNIQLKSVSLNSIKSWFDGSRAGTYAQQPTGTEGNTPPLSSMTTETPGEPEF